MNNDDVDDAKQAADKLTEMVEESYEAAVRRTAAMQQSNTRMARRFYEGSMEALEAQAEFNRHTLESLTELAREQREAFLRLSRESANAYDGFLDSLYAYYEEVSKEPKDR